MQVSVSLLFTGFRIKDNLTDKQASRDTGQDFTVLVKQAVVCPVNAVTVEVPREALKTKAGDSILFSYCQQIP